MAAKHPERTPNFSPGEKECLFNLLVTQAHILEDKKTNRVTLEEKNKVWSKIEAEFNNVAPLVCYRNAEQLRRLYENKKKELRKKIGDQKKQAFLTGGGPLPEFKWDPVDEILISIINPKSVTGLNMPFDSDRDDNAIPQKATLNQPIVLEVSADDIYTLDELDASVMETDLEPKDTSVQEPSCSYTTGKRLRKESEKENLQSSKTSNTTPKSASRRRPQTGVKALTSSDVSEKYNILLDRRLLLLNRQVEQIAENQNFAREEHLQKMASIKQQREIFAVELEEKKMKLEILKLELAHKKSSLT